MHKKNDEKIKYQGRFLQVKEVSIDNYTWEKAYFPDSVVVLPFLDMRTLLFVEERRPHESTETRVKLVTGHIDPGEDVTLAANRELMEEIGYKAEHLHAFYAYESTGTLNSHVHFVAAKDLKSHKIPNPDGEESIVQVIEVPIKNLEEQLMTHKITWSLSTLALFKVVHLYKQNQLDNLFKDLHI